MEELVGANILTPRKDGTEVYYINEELIRILQRQESYPISSHSHSL